MSHISRITSILTNANFFSLRPSRSITQVAWRPLANHEAGHFESQKGQQSEKIYLAVASEDCSLRLLSIGSIPQD